MSSGSSSGAASDLALDPRTHARAERWRSIRRDLHAHPELGYREERTSRVVADLLEGYGLSVTRGVGGTGVVAQLDGRRGTVGPTIALRADMDALPMQELNQFEHRSQNAGVFHGCGHDGHTTMLLAAAECLAEDPDFDGRVVFVFQPAEEGLAGAKAMIEDGFFERFPCDEVYGLHNWPAEPFGTFVANPGVMMAASDLLEIEITGKGGHAAMPHTTIDPVWVAAQVIVALQGLVSRGADPGEGSVLSITAVESGTTYNVIPESALLKGTCRSLSPARRDALEAQIQRVAEGVSHAHGARADVRYRRNYPPTINAAEPAAWARAAAADVLGPQAVHSDRPPSMGGEDFAFFLEHRPGCYAWIGQGGESGACAIHNPHYDFNDSLLPVGASYWIRLVQRRLSEPADGPSSQGASVAF